MIANLMSGQPAQEEDNGGRGQPQGQGQGTGCRRRRVRHAYGSCSWRGRHAKIQTRETRVKWFKHRDPRLFLFFCWPLEGLVGCSELCTEQESYVGLFCLGTTCLEADIRYPDANIGDPTVRNPTGPARERERERERERSHATTGCFCCRLGWFPILFYNSIIDSLKAIYDLYITVWAAGCAQYKGCTFPSVGLVYHCTHGRLCHLPRLQQRSDVVFRFDRGHHEHLFQVEAVDVVMIAVVVGVGATVVGSRRQGHGRHFRFVLVVLVLVLVVLLFVFLVVMTTKGSVFASIADDQPPLPGDERGETSGRSGRSPSPSPLWCHLDPGQQFVFPTPYGTAARCCRCSGGGTSGNYYYGRHLAKLLQYRTMECSLLC